MDLSEPTKSNEIARVDDPISKTEIIRPSDDAERMLTRQEFQELADVPAVFIWLSNIRSPNTRRAYQRDVGENADFRKFDDGLKMTIDCDADTLRDVTKLLETARAAGTCLFGLHQQDEAMMTCIVPSIMENTHVHFIDGAAGGYTQAATQIKNA